jgi:FtsH-binding integral membrane protein
MNSYYIYHKIFAIIGILLFSAYIVYDTNVILQKNYFGDFITASLDYYLDIINLFINLVNFQNQ